MIDIGEPLKRIYNEQEKTALQDKFILLLHTLLLFYLTLHNFLIPFITNILKNVPLLEGVHWWFLFQLPVQFYLRKGIKVPRSYILFLILGSFARLIVELYFASNLKSWSIASVLISEISSAIFYSVYFSLTQKDAFLAWSILGLAISPILSMTEVESLSHRETTEINLIRENDSMKLGCLGSSIQLNFPLKNSYKVKSLVNISDCGLNENVVYSPSDFSLVNQRSQKINFRIYKLQALYGKVKWKFLRLVQVGPGERWMPGKLIPTDTISLIKSPENRNLGHLVLIPLDYQDFILGRGVLTLDYDSLKWKGNE